MNSLKILGWPHSYITESSLMIEEEFPKTYGSVKPVEILHGSSDNYSNDPLEIRSKTLASFIIRFKIVDFLCFSQTVKDRQGLINSIQSSVISAAQQGCIKNSLAYNLKNNNEINEAILEKLVEITADFGVKFFSVDFIIKLSSETNELLNKYSKSRVEGFSTIELEKALYFAKGQGISKLAELLGIDDTSAVYKMESIGQSLKKNNFNFSILNDQDKDFAQKMLFLFRSSQDL
jgi:hypothetical protein